MEQREIIKSRKAVALFLLLVAAMLVCSCASSSKTTSIPFQHHQTLTSGVLEENDTLLFPNHIILEQDLDELDVSIQVTPHNMHVGDEAGVSVWVDGENHADAIVFKNRPATEYVIYRFVVNGEDYPICSVFLGFPSKHQALLHIKRVGDDIVFFQPYDREVARIGLSQLYRNSTPKQRVGLVMYAIQAENHQPFMVDFDY